MKRETPVSLALTCQIGSVSTGRPPPELNRLPDPACLIARPDPKSLLKKAIPYPPPPQKKIPKNTRRTVMKKMIALVVVLLSVVFGGNFAATALAGGSVESGSLMTCGSMSYLHWTDPMWASNGPVVGTNCADAFVPGVKFYIAVTAKNILGNHKTRIMVMKDGVVEKKVDSSWQQN